MKGVFDLGHALRINAEEVFENGTQKNKKEEGCPKKVED